MPIFTYRCSAGHEFQSLQKTSVYVLPCDECQLEAARQIPTSVNTVVMETRDPRRGVQVRKGLEKQLRERMNNYHDRYELEAKIDEFGTKDAQKHGWFKRVKKT